MIWRLWVQTPLGAIFDEIYFVLCNFRSVRWSDRNAYRENSSVNIRWEFFNSITISQKRPKCSFDILFLSSIAWHNNKLPHIASEKKIIDCYCPANINRSLTLCHNERILQRKNLPLSICLVSKRPNVFAKSNKSLWINLKETRGKSCPVVILVCDGLQIM